MQDRRQCEFFLVRYVPDTVRNEFVNIGVLLREAGEAATTVVRFTRDWARVRCMDPDADTAMLEALEAEVRQRLTETGPDVQPVMRVLEDSFSNSVQLTAARGCLAESIVAEVDALMRLYVEPRRQARVARRSGRQIIHAQMRTEFERAGVWDLMRKRIAAAEYTRAGDTLKLDCGYRPNGVIRMFHAVSLEGDVELAKVLAYSVADLRAGIERVERATLELTALVEPLREVSEPDEYRFAVEAMERQQIRVMTTTDLPRLAETARRELHV